MSREIKIEEDPDCYCFQCTSEVILESDVVKIEVNEDIEYEDNAKSTEMKLELENVESSRFTTYNDEEEEGVNEVVDVKTAPMSPVAVLTRPTESPIKANDMSRPKRDKSNGDSLLSCDLKPYVCNICNKDFKHPSTLREHKFIHSKEYKPYVCNVCDRGFSQPSVLRHHKYTHTGEKRFTCDFCRKTFRQKSNMQTHLNNVHYAIKPYVCDVCNKCFSQSSHLRQHQSTHTGEKPFSCDFCKKMFSRKSYLKRHLNIHTGIKPHVCDVCNKCFSRSTSLRQHTSIHTKEK